MINKKIGVVTVLYNSSNMLSDFFTSLNTQSYNNFVLYIVNNNSPDNSLQLSKELAATVKFKVLIIDNDENFGVAKGNNIGIKAALDDGCDYILLSNNDIYFSSTVIEQILYKAVISKSELVVPKIFFFDSPKLIWYAGGKFNMFYRPIHYGYMKEDNMKFESEKNVSYAPTCFMLIKSSVFCEVGFMDENFFVYYDDTDFAWRSMILNKKRLLYYPSVFIFHKEGASTGGNKSDFSLYYQGRNQIYFALKNMTFFQRILYFSYETIRYIIKEIPTLNKSQRRLLLNAFKDGVRLYKTVK